MHPIRQPVASARRLVGRGARRLGLATRADLNRLESRLGVHDRVLDDLAAGTRTLSSAIDAVERSREHGARRLGELTLVSSIEPMMRWINHARLDHEPLLSVVLPTRDRRDLLARAIDSVLAQRYSNWELLVVADGDAAEARKVAADSRDARVRYLGIPLGGVSAARNSALREARGEFVAYLDDDNIMDPGWLFSVAWAFAQRPDIDVLYGGFMIDDVGRLGSGYPTSLPRAFLHGWDREALARGNLTDVGSIAHRAGLSGAWFDESLREMGDWDLLIRLTAQSDPLVLPVISHFYMTDAPNRLTRGPTHDEDRDKVLARASEFAP